MGMLYKLQKAYEEGKEMKGIEWSEDDENAECYKLTDESTEESEDEIDDDIDVQDCNWNSPKTKIEISDHSDDDSLSEEESEEEEDEAKLEVAQYQKHVYQNDQPMMKIKQAQSARQAIDW